MISKIMEFKIAIWEKAGKHTASRGQRVLLATLIGIGTIAWQLLRFIGSVLNAILVDDHKDKGSFLRSQEKQAEREKDAFGRKPRDPFYGEPMSDMMIWQGIKESKDNWKT